MPKKRHQGNFSKPQSTAPASLVSSSSGSPRSGHHDEHSGRGVNERLAELRRLSLRSQQPFDHTSSLLGAPGTPSLPPAVRRILQLPETPAPPPRRPVRVSRHGARPPPGPAAPRSWMSRPERAALSTYGSPREGTEKWQYHDLPGAYHPSQGSLMDMVLRKTALDWEFQKSYNRYYLYYLPSHLKVALIAYLSRWHPDGVSIPDMRAILLPCPDDDEAEETQGDGSNGSGNEDLSHLDLTGSIGRPLKLRELSDFLFPRTSARTAPTRAPQQLQESWDEPEPEPEAETGGKVPETAIPRPLLPNLTHLSLAVSPQNASAGGAVSWRHLLAFAAHLPTLTHLSLAHWPEPCLTPNARLASATFTAGANSGPARAVQLAATGPYSHSLDGDWSEAVSVLRRLARALYGLEWLDLSGCAAWALPALATAVDGHGSDRVDWVGDWGRVATVLLRPRRAPVPRGSPLGDELYAAEVAAAPRLERYIRGRRGGVGRPIRVDNGVSGSG